MWREGVELGRVRVIRAEGGARELDHHALHSHAETERRDASLAAETGRLHLALDAAVSEAAWNDDAIESDERFHVVRAFEMLAVDPLQLHIAAGRPGRVAHGFRD